MQYIKFGQNPSFGSRDRVHTSFFESKFDIQSAGVTLKMRSRSPKPNTVFAFLLQSPKMKLTFLLHFIPR